MRCNRPLYSKYSCDDKLGIYSNPKISKKNYQYKKAISGVRSKYMQDYNESKRISKYSEEKQFNNLLSNYYQDYNILKSKYNFINEEENDKNEYDITEEEYFMKKQKVEKIFSGDLLDIQDFNFDFTDNLINDFPKENNYSLIKNTQIKDDYDFRLQGFSKNNKYMVPNEDKIEDEENENENEYEENIKNNNKINNIKNEEQDKKNIKEEDKNNKGVILENENENDKDNNISQNENKISENNNINNDINEYEEKTSIGYLEDDKQFNLENNENYLILNQPGLNENLPLFSDIISANYNEIYRIPFYEHPDNLLVEEENVIKEKEDEY